MITPKQWQEFNEYRDKVRKDVVESHEWNNNTEKISKLQELLKPRTVNGWFGTHIERVSPFSMISIAYDIEFYLQCYDLLLYKVPSRTVEACLDWLLNKKFDKKLKKE